MAPTFISIFAGCGGSSLGYKLAGYKELLAIDFDKNAVKTFQLNFDCPAWERDISNVSVKEVLTFCNLKKGELDLLDGSPPCQGFSMAGKRQINDDRNSLYLEFMRLIEGIQPKVFVIENVSGLVEGRMKGVFIEIMKQLKSLNYEVKCKLMNSMYYNVPQSRQRLIWIGIRKDLNTIPTFPKPNNKIITVRKAWEGIKNKTYCKDIKGYHQEKFFPCIKQGTRGLNGKYFNYRRLAFNKVSPTLLKATSWAGFPMSIHPIEDRGLTMEEARRLCSFPDTFQLTGTFVEQWAVLGNAVMPKFMEAIATHIKNNISDE